MRKFVVAVAALAALAAVLPASAVPAPVGSTAVGAGPTAVAWNPVNRLFYVANSSDDALSVVAAAGTRTDAAAPLPAQAGAGAEIARIAVGDGPAGVAVHPQTGVVYVSNQGSDSISVVTGLTAGEPLRVGDQPWGMAVDAQTNRLCVAMFGDDEVFVIDTETMTTIAVLEVPGGPIGVAAGGGRCFITSFYSGKVTAIDAASPAVVWSSLSVSGLETACPNGVALYPGSPARMYVANECHGSLSAINPVNGGILFTQSLGSGSGPVGVAASLTSVYVTKRGHGTIGVLNPETGAGVSLPSGSLPMGIAVSGSPECALAANFASQTASMICDVL